MGKYYKKWERGLPISFFRQIVSFSVLAGTIKDQVLQVLTQFSKRNVREAYA
jgi:hypothetical protein